VTAAGNRSHGVVRMVCHYRHSITGVVMKLTCTSERQHLLFEHQNSLHIRSGINVNHQIYIKMRVLRESSREWAANWPSYRLRRPLGPRAPARGSSSSVCMHFPQTIWYAIAPKGRIEDIEYWQFEITFSKRCETLHTEMLEYWKPCLKGGNPCFCMHCGLIM
jgi:hypothetical protein